MPFANNQRITRRRSSAGPTPPKRPIGNNSESKALFARVFNYFMVITFFVWTLLTLFISEIFQLNVAGVSLIGPAFVEAQSIVPIILLAYVFQGAYLNFLPGIYFEEKTKYIAAITGLSAAVNIIIPKLTPINPLTAITINHGCSSLQLTGGNPKIPLTQLNKLLGSSLVAQSQSNAYTVDGVILGNNHNALIAAPTFSFICVVIREITSANPTLNKPSVTKT